VTPCRPSKPTRECAHCARFVASAPLKQHRLPLILCIDASVLKRLRTPWCPMFEGEQR